MHSIVSSVSNPSSPATRPSPKEAFRSPQPTRTRTSLLLFRPALSSCLSTILCLVAISSFMPATLAYPATMILRYQPSLHSAREDSHPSFSVSKRAFDRLDMSPFDFEALSKRYIDDGDDYFRNKKAFDRVDENGFFGLVRRRRAFDRLEDNSFMFGRKRRSQDDWPSDNGLLSDDDSGVQRQQSVLLAKRPFDRLDSSAFVAKKSSPLKQRLSIAQLLQQYPSEHLPTQSETASKQSQE